MGGRGDRGGEATSDGSGTAQSSGEGEGTETGNERQAEARLQRREIRTESSFTLLGGESTL